MKSRWLVLVAILIISCGAVVAGPPATEPAGGKQNIADKPGKDAVKTEAVKYEITIDYSETPDLKDWVETKLRPVCDAWYPKIVAMLPVQGYTPPRRFTIKFDKSGRGVAYTMGTDVHCAARWFRKNLDGEAAGAVVHEMVHVVQLYGHNRRGHENPGWMVEGVADYVRWFNYEPKPLRPHVNPDRAHYTDSYRTTAAFLNYVVEKHDKALVVKFNAAMHRGEYSPELWKKYTGKTVDELWDEYTATLKNEK